MLYSHIIISNLIGPPLAIPSLYDYLICRILPLMALIGQIFRHCKNYSEYRNTCGIYTSPNHTLWFTACSNEHTLIIIHLNSKMCSVKYLNITMYLNLENIFYACIIILYSTHFNEYHAILFYKYIIYLYEYSNI